MLTEEAELDTLFEYLTAEERAALDRLLFDADRERERYRNDPVAFVREVIGAKPTHYQETILRAILTYRRVCVRSLHGVGKTTTSAWVVLWFATTHQECKVPTTASAWRQLKEFLWPEIHKWALKADWSKLGLKMRLNREILSQKLAVSPTATAFAMNSTDEAKIEGAHSLNILFLFDEAKTIPAEIWDAAEGALSTHGAYAVAFSTPGESAGRFYEIQMRKPGYEDWHVVHVSLDDAIKSGRVTKEWAEQRAKAWGAESAMYKRRVLGEFADDEAETVIPLGLIERAVERWYELEARRKRLIEEGMSQTEAFLEVWATLQSVGCDPARLGRDRSGFAYRYAPGIHHVERTVKQETMQTAGKLIADTRDTDATVLIDVIGIGAGVVDRMRELHRMGEWRAVDRVCPAKAVNVGVKTKFTDRTGEFRFRTLRDYLWWSLREALMRDELVLPPDQELQEDLVVAKFIQLSDGTITIESKDSMRERLPERRSPDTGDAVLLTCFPDVIPYTPMLAFL
jgi:hypothetical protein